MINVDHPVIEYLCHIYAINLLYFHEFNQYNA